MTIKLRLSTALVIPALLAASPALLGAQDAKPPTLDSILQRLESNLLHYHTMVPSFFCDEHSISGLVGPGMRRTITDSTFRLKRVTGSDGKITLTESREIKTINGRTAHGEDLAGPVFFQGAFSGGLSLVSISQEVCMRYTLQPIKPYATDPYIVEFSSVLVQQRPSGCLLQEEGAGRVFIDRDTMQVKRIELTAPHHTIVPASRTQSKLVGSWTVAVDYAPVELDDQTLWMPKDISSQARAVGYGVWTFVAEYSDYHKLEVTSHILPPSEASAP
jgi:hypothetical protein